MSVSPTLRLLLLGCLLLAGSLTAFGQETPVQDTLTNGDPVLTLREVNASPKRALLWAAIPGGGQVYNRAWWKVPIVYGGLLGIVAVADYNQTLYSRYVTALEQRCLGDGFVIDVPFAACRPRPNDPSLAETPTEGLIRARNSSNRNRQTSYVFIIAGYVLQAVEAFTDAHLKDFDIDDDLSLRVGPMVNPDGTAALGISVPLGTNRKLLRQEVAVAKLPAH